MTPLVLIDRISSEKGQVFSVPIFNGTKSHSIIIIKYFKTNIVCSFNTSLLKSILLEFYPYRSTKMPFGEIFKRRLLKYKGLPVQVNSDSSVTRQVSFSAVIMRVLNKYPSLFLIVG